MARKPGKAKRSARSAALNARQAAFVRHYTAGVDGVRGNATASYVAAGYSTQHAHVAGPRLLANVRVRAAIEAAHARAERAAARRLRDWKALAPEAQTRLETLARGLIPDGEDPERGRAMGDRDDAAVANVVFGALREILERAQPKKLALDLDPKGALAQALGLSPEQLPNDGEPL